MLIFGGVSQGGKKISYLTYYLGQYCSKLNQYYNELTHRHAWYIDPDGIKNLNTTKYPIHCLYQTNVTPSLYIPKWHQEKTIYI